MKGKIISSSEILADTNRFIAVQWTGRVISRILYHGDSEEKAKEVIRREGLNSPNNPCSLLETKKVYWHYAGIIEVNADDFDKERNADPLKSFCSGATSYCDNMDIDIKLSGLNISRRLENKNA